MQPITREIIDRRAPAIRWSAVLAGTAAAIGLWGVFQLIGLGTGLASLDPDDARSLRHAAVGMTGLSVLAPLVATFVGGWLAARLCAHSDRKVAAGHAFVVWGLTTAAGLVATLWMASAAAIGAAHTRHDVAYDRTYVVDDVAVTDETAGPDRPIDAPVVKTTPSANQITRAHEAVDPVPATTGRIDDPALRLAPEDRVAMARAKEAGKGFLTLGVAILLSIGTAILGALVGLRTFERRPHTTAPYRAVDETL